MKHEPLNRSWVSKAYFTKTVYSTNICSDMNDNTSLELVVAVSLQSKPFHHFIHKPKVSEYISVLGKHDAR